MMMMNYRKNLVTDKKQPKPFWLRLCRNDALNVVYQDKGIVFTQGQIYYGCLVQINQLLFDKSNRLTRSKLRYRRGRIKQ